MKILLPIWILMIIAALPAVGQVKTVSFYCPHCAKYYDGNYSSCPNLNCPGKPRSQSPNAGGNPELKPGATSFQNGAFQFGYSWGAWLTSPDPQAGSRESEARKQAEQRQSEETRLHLEQRREIYNRLKANLKLDSTFDGDNGDSAIKGVNRLDNPLGLKLGDSTGTDNLRSKGTAFFGDSSLKGSQPQPNSLNDPTVVDLRDLRTTIVDPALVKGETATLQQGGIGVQRGTPDKLPSVNPATQQTIKQGDTANPLGLKLGDPTTAPPPANNPNVIDLRSAKTLVVDPVKLKGESIEPIAVQSVVETTLTEKEEEAALNQLFNQLFRRGLTETVTAGEEVRLFNELYRRALVERRFQIIHLSESDYLKKRKEDYNRMIERATKTLDVDGDFEKQVQGWYTIQAVKDHREKELLDLRRSSTVLARVCDQIDAEERKAIHEASLRMDENLRHVYARHKRAGKAPDNSDPEAQSAIIAFNHLAEGIKELSIKRRLEAGHQVITLKDNDYEASEFFYGKTRKP